MELDWLFEPIDEAAPCGPDLERADDDAFVDYYYEAESRMPERYFTPGMTGLGRDGREGAEDRLFDPRSVRLARETEIITGLLRRSRDLRLLSLLARFQILAGRVPDFADSVEAMAGLLERFPQAVHPDASAGVSDRRGALDGLASQPAVVSALQHLNLLEQAHVSLRLYQVATGQAEARAGETGLEAGGMVSALRHPGHAAEVARLHDALARSILALTRIEQQVRRPEVGPFTVDLSAPVKMLRDIQALIAQARPDLQVTMAEAPAPEPEAAQAPPEAAPAGSGSGTGTGSAPVAAALPTAPTVANRAEARARLIAAEGWLARAEPSSPALLLVVQARLLIGKPLIEALETLMPADAPRAVIAFSPDSGFALPMERLRALTGAAAADPEPEPDPAAIATPPLRDRAALAGELAALEGWFRGAEPASPIPILLARARTFLDRGFESILSEIIPRTPQA